MPTALLRMIGQQADALDRMAGLELARPAAVLAAAGRVVLTGTGTSQHAAELGAMMLAAAGLDTRWYPAATWARWGPGPRAGDVVCGRAFVRAGQSAAAGVYSLGRFACIRPPHYAPSQHRCAA